MRLTSLIRREFAIRLPRVAPALTQRILSKHGIGPNDAALDFEDMHTGAAFDVQSYRSQAGIDSGDDQALMLHYLLVGARRGYRPSPTFDPEQYRRHNPDIIASGYEPFTHARRFAKLEHRFANDDQTAEPSVPSLDNVLQIPMQPPRDSVRVNVIIPVYSGYADTLRTIAHVLAAKNAAAFDLVVVDDASPDPAIRAALDALGERQLIRLVRNGTNAGFVASVNRGMALDPDRDVILLNSDTAVFGDWLDRLLAVLNSEARVGTVTPLSNAATILSYPIWLKDNALLPSESPRSIDQACREIGLSPIEIPTAVGFCMAIRRRCLDAVGPFDEQTFGKGYGEENDFCRRAIKKGWLNVAASNVFVWHKGGGTFGPEKASRVAAAQIAIERLHPGYRSTIRRFIRRDPLHNVRARIDAQMLISDPRPKVLVDGLGETNPDSLRLALMPDIAPYFGSYRVVSLDGPRAVNFPRFGKKFAASDLQDILQKIRLGALV